MKRRAWWLILPLLAGVLLLGAQTRRFQRLEVKELNGVRTAASYKTSGAGTQANPYVGWEGAVAANTETVLVKGKYFQLTSSLTLPAGATLRGGGTILFNQAGTPNAGIVNATDAGDITIEGITIDHDGTTAASIVSAIHITAGTGQNYTIRDVTITDAGLDGIRIVGSAGVNTNVKISGVSVVTADRHCIELSSDVSYASVSHSYASDCNTVTVGAAIYAGSAASAGHITVTGNVVDTTGDNGIRTIGSDVTIASNVVTGAAIDGIRLAGDNNTAVANIVYGNTENGIKIEDGNRFVVSGNISRNNVQDGIQARYTSGTSAGISITGNTVESNTFDGIRIYSGATDITISGNVSRLNRNNIVLESVTNNISNVNITGNTCFEASSDSDIHLKETSGSIDSVLIAGNFLDGNSSATAEGGINIPAGTTNVRVVDNESQGHDTSELSIPAGNIVYIRHRGAGAPALAAEDGSMWYRTDGSGTNDAVYMRINTGWEFVRSGAGATMLSGADPGATCSVGDVFLDTDETVDTNCTTTADNSLCLCTATDTWTALENN